MRNLRLDVVAVCIATLAMWGCGKELPFPGASEKVVPKKAVEEKVAPYTYPAPVKGHYKEINVGEFDLVDGIAYPATGGAGTVVYVADKPIASPMIAGSACPMTQARVLAELRNAKYLEVTLTMAHRNISPQARISAAAAASKRVAGATGRAE
jgi:hypothetical protein